MKKINMVWLICIGGLLTTITVLFQSAPVFLPAIGLALSPFSSLPVAIAAVFHVSLGFAVLFSSSLILVVFNIQEAVILFFTTGALGMVIGTLLYRKGIFISIFISSIALSLGMMCLTYIIHISAFTDLTGSLSIPLTFLIFYIFSLVYATIWNICFKKFMGYLIKIKPIT
ncbi:hypothetical protein [Lacrimispora indolis]|uniref:hypothetical protein n=1 Tax=Lacrimispora indolis TaxID=69825 RepID=UPI0004625653|nr:hypothetical protein [[Clostridium] methoxybenzovorans]